MSGCYVLGFTDHEAKPNAFISRYTTETKSVNNTKSSLYDWKSKNKSSFQIKPFPDVNLKK